MLTFLESDLFQTNFLSFKELAFFFLLIFLSFEDSDSSYDERILHSLLCFLHQCRQFSSCSVILLWFTEALGEKNKMILLSFADQFESTLMRLYEALPSGCVWL